MNKLDEMEKWIRLDVALFLFILSALTILGGYVLAMTLGYGVEQVRYRGIITDSACSAVYENGMTIHNCTLIVTEENGNKHVVMDLHEHNVGDEVVNMCYVTLTGGLICRLRKSNDIVKM